MRTGASSGLKEYRLNNVRIDNQKNLLKSVGLIQAGERYTGDEIEQLYQTNIRSYRADSAGFINPENALEGKGRPKKGINKRYKSVSDSVVLVR